MATIHADPGSEHYFSLSTANAVIAGVWTAIGGGSFVNTAPVGRQAASDGKVYAILFANGNQNASKSFGPSYSHLIWHFAVYFSSSPISCTIFQFLDNANVQVDIRTDAGAHPILTRNGTTIGTSTAVCPAGWNFFELDVTFATGATGAAQLWLNNVSILNLTSVQTANTNASANGFKITGTNGIGNIYFRDLVGLDATTGANTTHLGDVTVGVSYPNAAGVNQQWTPNAGTQVSRVQDGITHTGTWPDGDSTYISDGTAGHISDFAHETLTLTGTLYAVGHVTYARKDDAGTRAFRQVCLSGGTTETNGADINATNTFLYYSDFLDQDPNTSAQWTVANYNAATFGVKEIT